MSQLNVLGITVASAFLLALLIAGIGCGRDADGRGGAHEPPTPEPEHIVVAVFADLTTSVDSGHVDAIARNVYRLVMMAPPGAHVMIHSVDQSSTTPAILDYTIPQVPDVLQDFNPVLSEVIAQAEMASNKVRDLYTNVYAERRDQSLTCLLRTLNKANNIFRRELLQHEHQRIPGAFRFHLVYLSDMVEECADSELGPLYMTRGRFHPEILTHYNPGFDLGDAELTIVRSSQSAGTESPAIPTEELEDAWATLFERAGFTREQVSTAWRYDEIDLWPTSPWE